jgi:hypothetical protein
MMCFFSFAVTVATISRSHRAIWFDFLLCCWYYIVIPKGHCRTVSAVEKSSSKLNTLGVILLFYCKKNLVWIYFMCQQSEENLQMLLLI